MQRFDSLVLTETNEQGIARVRRDKYAYILPSTIGEYINLRYPCDLVTVDSFLMNRGYALAVPRDSPLKDKLNKALRVLKKNGFLNRLYHRWWTSGSECNGIQTGHLHSPAGAPTWAICTLTLLMSMFMLQHCIITSLLLPLQTSFR